MAKARATGGGIAPDKAALAKLGETVRTRLSQDPSVYRVPVEGAEIFAVTGFLSTDECTHLIGLIDAVARPSEVFDQPYQDSYRTSYSGDVDAEDNFVRMIDRRLSDLLGIDLAWSERVQGQRYGPGQQFKGHCDWFDTAAAYWPGEVPRGGQRSWTAMIYLNEVEDGGLTEFPLLGVSITPDPGLLLVWNNAKADGLPNYDTKHAALPVISGTKYIITKWFRTREWE